MFVAVVGLSAAVASSRLISSSDFHGIHGGLIDQECVCLCVTDGSE